MTMVGEGTTAIFITFLLAIIGYAGLTAVVLLSARGTVPFRLWRAVAAIILTHVIMVWMYRYGWAFSLAVRNGYAGFVLFHTALLMIGISTVARAHVARLLIQLAFGIVTLGALGASFTYDVVALYRVPVVVCALSGMGGLLWTYVLQRRATKRVV